LENMDIGINTGQRRERADRAFTEMLENDHRRDEQWHNWIQTSLADKEDIDRMMRDAEAHADEDKQRREEAEVRNNAEALVYQTEKFLADNADKVPAEAKENVEGPLEELKKAIEENDGPGMRSATDKVAAASQALGAAMYSDAQADGSEEGAEAAADKSEEDVVDAEIVDEDESK